MPNWSSGPPLWEMLRILRQQTGMSQAKLAHVVGASPMHIGVIERPHTRERSVPSVELLRKLVDVLVPIPEDRPATLLQVLLARARMTAPPEIASRLTLDATAREGPAPPFSAGGFPAPFLARLRHDLHGMAKQDLAHLVAAIDCSEERFQQVLKGHGLLSSQQVLGVANQLRQPEDDYLILAGYLPLWMQDVLTLFPATRQLLTHVGYMSETRGRALIDALIAVAVLTRKGGLKSDQWTPRVVDRVRRPPRRRPGQPARGGRPPKST